MNETKKLVRLQIDSPARSCDLLQGILGCKIQAGWQEEELPENGARFSLFFENPEQCRQIAAEIGRLAPECSMQTSWREIADPLEAWKEFFTPVICGSRFVALPPWLAEEPAAQPHKIVIEPKSAFGTGQHASTALCLTALDWLAEKRLLTSDAKFLDLGCGSGILGIAASKLGMAGIGMDIDPIAIANAVENRKLNHADKLELAVGSQEDLPAEKFGLIFANILAGPLMAMSPRLSLALADGGWLILSGILKDQAHEVRAKYEACHLRLFRLREDGEWACLIFHKPACPQVADEA